MRTIFFGTPEFAVPTLRAMVESGYAPLAVITRPARPVGRGHKLHDPPVAVWAAGQELEVLQPEKVNTRSFRGRLAELAPDVAVVVAFGQIFKRRLLRLPDHGCINLHASLLPRYRGAAPIQAAIAAGDKATGVTTMVMDEGLDTGPMLLQEEVEISAEDTTPELAARLAERGAGLMVATLRALERGDLTPREQPEEGASYAPMLSPEDGLVDWDLSANEISCHLRAYTPWPGQSSFVRGKRVKLLSVVPGSEATQAPPGTVIALHGESLSVACGGGTVLELHRVQAAGKRPVSAAAFAHGARLRPGARFGAEDML